MTIETFINKAKYDPLGQKILAVSKNDEYQMLLDLRGWGAIQHLFKSQDEAAKFQDSLGEWIADAINQKLNK